MNEILGFINEKTEGKHYVFGDTHGAWATVKKMIDELQINPRIDFIYFVGDYYYPLMHITDDDKNIFQYFNQYYVNRFDYPGIHLIRGNHEWSGNHIEECFENIYIKDLPDIIRLEVSGQEFVIAHSGMHEDIYNFMVINNLKTVQLDTSWMHSEVGRKYYNAIIWTKKTEFPTYSETKELKNNEKTVIMIHGHCPVYYFTDSDSYKIVKCDKSNRKIAAVNENTKWIDIDAGIKEKDGNNRSLTVICLEDFVEKWTSEATILGSVKSSITNIEFIPNNNQIEWDKNIDFDNKVVNVEMKQLVLDKKLNIAISERTEIVIDNINFNNRIFDDFFNAMKIVSNATVNIKTNGIENYEEINQSIIKIIEFVQSNHSANLMVSNMFGFMLEENTISKLNEWDNYLLCMPQKQYLYFVADLKIKATVYLLRIHNFIYSDGLKSVDLNDISIQEKIFNLELSDIGKFFGVSDFVDAYKDIEIIGQITEQLGEKFTSTSIDFLGEKSESKKRNAIKYLEICLEILKKQDGENIHKLICQNAELELQMMDHEEDEKIQDLESMPIFIYYSINLNKVNKCNLLDISYYLFDNSMREIEFNGIEWEWLWKYEKGSANLYRCVGTDSFTYFGDIVSTGRKYYQEMIKNIVLHMNKGDNKPKLASYSKNPYRDIYKYMSVDKEKGNYRFKIKKEKNEYQAELYIEPTVANDILYYSKSVIFAIIQNAETNIIKPVIEETCNESDYSIKVGSKDKYYKTNEIDSKSFNDFIQESETEVTSHVFCVDILNSQVPSRGDIRTVFQNYTNQFPDQFVHGLQRNVVSSSDEEVVMLGNTCKNIIHVNNNLKPEMIDDNTEYRIELNGKDIITLFRKLNNKEKEQLKKKIKIRAEDTNGEYIITISGKTSNIKVIFENEYADDENEDIEEDEKITSEEINKKNDAKERKKIEVIKEAIFSYISEIKSDEEDLWKIPFIMTNVKYDGNKNYGNVMYRDGDSFIDLCRLLYLR